VLGKKKNKENKKRELNDPVKICYNGIYKWPQISK
jgi:hypothetical protein